MDTGLLTKQATVYIELWFWSLTQVSCLEDNTQRKRHRNILVIQSHLASTMRHWLFAALFLFLVAYQANGWKITNSTNNGHAQIDEATIVCNQYIGTDAGTNEAIKKLDEKLDQIIKLLL